MNLTGIGLYTLKEAEQLTGASAREASRWLFGYRYPNGESAPLWKTQLLGFDGHEKAIGFRDLLELRIVKQFLDHHVSLRVIRAAIENARTLFHTDYPFTAHRFLTDGKNIFYEAMSGESGLTDLAKRQLVFEHIIRPELYAGIEFDGNGEASRWFPVKRSKSIVLDPEMSFGKPILTQYGIRTNIIAQSYVVEQDKKMVAALFDIPVSAVDAALRYERVAA
jgi:uncharacterized protein (DUF433 family)